MRPVLYLDIDDTLLRWEHGRVVGAAKDAGLLLRWAARHMEIRWLSYRTSGGRLDAYDCDLLAEHTGLPPAFFHRIRGLDWMEGQSMSCTKADALAWVEILCHRRPFAWIEDGDAELHCPGLFKILADLSLSSCYIYCDVSRRPDDLGRALETVAARLGLPRPTLPAS